MLFKRSCQGPRQGCCPLSPWRARAMPLVLVAAVLALLAITPAEAITPVQGVQAAAAYNTFACDGTDVFIARSVQDVRAVIATARASGLGAKIRAVSHTDFHSAATFPCAKPPGALLTFGKGITLVLDMSAASVNVAQQLVTVGPSRTLYSLAVEVLEPAGLSIPSMAFPYHSSLTVGGVFLTAAHGANYGGAFGNMVDMVQCVQFVDWLSVVRTTCRNSADGGALFRGVAGGLGLLGVVTSVTLRFEALSQTRTRFQIQTFSEDEAPLRAKIEELRGNPSIDSLFVLWRPDFKRYSVYIGSTVPATTPFNPAGPNNLGPQNVLTAGLSLQQYGLVSVLLRLYNSPGGLFLNVTRASTLCSNCLAELLATRPELAPLPIHELIQQFAAILYTPVWAAVSNGSNPVGTPLDPLDVDPIKAATARDLTGSSNRLSMSFPCPESYDATRDAICFYESLTIGGQTLPKISFEDTELALDDSRLFEFMEDVRAVVNQDVIPAYAGTGLTPSAAFGSGVQFRWSKKSDTLLGMNGRGNVVWVGLEALVPVKDFALSSLVNLTNPDYPWPDRSFWWLTILEQRLLCQYKARPHWGKNRDRTFLHPGAGCSANAIYGSDITTMSRLQNRFDLLRIFQPPLYTRVTATNPITLYTPLCDLKKECYCQNDLHCGLYHECKPSVAFPEFKVCKPKPGYDTTLAALAGLAALFGK